MKNAFKLGAFATLLSVSIVACDPAKDKKKDESVTETKTEIDTAKNDTSAAAAAVTKDTIVTKEMKKIEVKKQ